MIQLSIIIPCVGSQSSFDDTVLSVLENRPDQTEVIVPCRSDYVDPYSLDDEVIFLKCGNKADVIELLNFGIQSSQGKIVHWIQPGNEANPNWADAALQCFSANDRVSTVAPLIRARSDQRIVSAGVNYLKSGERQVVRRGKKRNTVFRAMGPSISAGFCRREVLTATDGFSSWAGPEFADVDLASVTNAAGLECAVVSDCMLYGEMSTKRIGFSSARRLERLYWKLAQLPNAKPNLMAHLARVVWYSAIRFPRWSTISSSFGRMVGMFDARKNLEDARKIVGRLKSSHQKSPTEFEQRRAA